MTALSVFLTLRLYRQKSDIQELLERITHDRDRMIPAIHNLVELLTEIANASALSGNSEYLLAKRLDLILSSPRGEGRAIKDQFMTVADLHESGMLTHLEQQYPELTRSEIGLCGMITLGLEPPCISRILGYDHVQTFYNKRTDLRKKLHLEREDSLEGFLAQTAAQLRMKNELYFRHLKRKY
ncbi:MAG: hypothetical protein IKX34_08870 [Bacteroidales bacterium]|nr:hypothetical protein [Bacteroidales bacterium]